MEITFLDTKITLEFANYQNNNNIYIGAYETETGEPFMDISVNTDKTLPNGQVSIKNYSENEGILDVLVAEGIVSKPVDTIFSGHVAIPVCNLLAEIK